MEEKLSVSKLSLIVLSAAAECAVLEIGVLSEGMGSQKVEELQGADFVDKGPQEDGQAKTSFTLPRYNPLSSDSTGLRAGARLKVRLARLQMEDKAQDQQAQLRF